jgi:hypothetical protein
MGRNVDAIIPAAHSGGQGQFCKSPYRSRKPKRFSLVRGQVPKDAALLGTGK